MKVGELALIFIGVKVSKEDEMLAQSSLSAKSLVVSQSKTGVLKSTLLIDLSHEAATKILYSNTEVSNSISKGSESKILIEEDKVSSSIALSYP